MRIGIGQLNLTVGDLEGNRSKIAAASQTGADQGCGLVLTPELSISGYPPQDLLFKRHFITDQLDLVHKVLPAELSVTTVVGFVDLIDDRLYNAAAVIAGGEVRQVVHKSLLPTYDVFDEWRYFTPAKQREVSQINGTTVGITICEDLWDDGYETKVVKELAGQGAELIVNISSSPFHCNKFVQRTELCSKHSARHRLPVVYCNLVGAQDELVFDGNSFVTNRNGGLQLSATAFDEQFLVYDTDEPGINKDIEQCDDTELLGALRIGTRDYLHKCGFQKAVIGLSGGIDSALVACIAAEALGPQNVLCVSMPSRYTSDASNDDARVLAENLGTGYCVLPIEESVQLAVKRFSGEFGDYHSQLTVENLQARERGKILMEISNDQGSLVLATGNKTEYALGYSTLYGDMCGGLAVIGDVSKPEVYGLCRYYNRSRNAEVIPDRIITRPPSAELRDNQVDPFDYDTISPLVDMVVEDHASKSELLAAGYNDKDIELVFRLVRLNEYKRRQAPPIIRVTEKAFGVGRKMPIVNRYRY